MDSLKAFLWKLSYDTKAISEIVYCSVGSFNWGKSDNRPLIVNNMRYVNEYLVDEYSSSKLKSLSDITDIDNLDGIIQFHMTSQPATIT